MSVKNKHLGMGNKTNVTTILVAPALVLICPSSVM